MARKLVLFTYTLRPDVDEQAYDDYMRSTDFPRFRSRPEVLAHSSWTVKQSLQGREAFARFDLIEVRDFDEIGPMLEEPEVAAHVRDWLTRWSVGGPDAADQTQNYQASFFEEVWG